VPLDQDLRSHERGESDPVAHRARFLVRLRSGELERFERCLGLAKALIEAVAGVSPDSAVALRSELALQLALCGAPPAPLSSVLGGHEFGERHAVQVAVAEWIAGDTAASERLGRALEELALPDASGQAEAQLEFVCSQLDLLFERGFAPPATARGYLQRALDARASINNVWLRPAGDWFARSPTLWTWALDPEELSRRAPTWAPPRGTPPGYLGESPLKRGLGLFALDPSRTTDLESLAEPWWRCLGEQLQDLSVDSDSPLSQITQWRDWLRQIKPYLSPDAGSLLRERLLEGEHVPAAALLDLCDLQLASPSESQIDLDQRFQGVWTLLSPLAYGEAHALTQGLVELALRQGSEELLTLLCRSLETWIEAIPRGHERRRGAGLPTTRGSALEAPARRRRHGGEGPSGRQRCTSSEAGLWSSRKLAPQLSPAPRFPRARPSQRGHLAKPLD